MKSKFHHPTKSLILFFLLIGALGNAQEEIQVKLTGIAPETEQQILPYDYIPSGFGLNNITLRIKNEGTNPWGGSSSAIYKVKYDPKTKHYDMGDGIFFTVKSTSRNYSLDKPLVIRVNATTAFGNHIWTEVKRSRENIHEPLILDQYTLLEGKPGTKPFYYLTLTGKKFLPYFSGTFLEGDLPIKENGLNVKLKNHSQGKYQTEHVGIINGSLSGKFNTKVRYSQNMDPSEPIEGLISIRTVFGNYIWTKFKRNADEIHNKTIVFDTYSGEAGNENAPLRTEPPVEIVESIPSENVSDSKKIIEIIESEVVEYDTDLGEEDKDLLTLKQHKGRLRIANLPEEVPSGNIKSTLVKSGSIIVGGQTFALKGDMPINYNMEKGYVLEAYANGNQKIETDYGIITIKDGTSVKFSQSRVLNVVLAEDATLETHYGDITAKAKQENNKSDLIFATDGKLTAVTIAQKTNFKIGGETFVIPEGSAIRLSSNKIYQIQLSQEIPHKIAGLNVSLMPGNSKSPSIKFSLKNEKISQLYVANSSPVTTSDGPLNVNNESLIRFDFNGTDYVVDKFE
ncbi:MAG: hypothetical protein ABJU26_10015, partial [Flavobacteriaceae bacterium]